MFFQIKALQAFGLQQLHPSATQFYSLPHSCSYINFTFFDRFGMIHGEIEKFQELITNSTQTEQHTENTVKLK